MALYQKNRLTPVSLYFNSLEFDCKCKSDCFLTPIDPDLVEKLGKMRQAIGKPIQITSGYRCKGYQEQLAQKGYETAKLSQHSFGRAADLVVDGITGLDLEKFAIDAGFMAIGVGTNFIHVDVRDDKPRRWEYNRR